MIGPYIDDLARRAAEARRWNAVIEVRCTRRDHAHAVAGVPCEPPSAEFPKGRVCIERHRREIDTREQREERRRREEIQERARQRAEWREGLASRDRGHKVARIAAATHRTEESS